jgi:hypothetical protein
MKNLILTLFLFTFSLSTLAQGKPTVMILDEHMNSEELEKDFKVQRNIHRSSLPSKEERDALLHGLKQIKDWEEYLKDKLYMDLGRLPVKELQDKYPEFSQKELQDLKSKR